MLENLAKRKDACWQVSAYQQLVPPLLDTLKSITGKTFSSHKEYKKWWDEEGGKFKVID